MTRPHVLLVCADHWPGRLLASAGHPTIQTPTLDQLAANGVRFANAYSATPTCIPARRALMTGMTARTHGDRIFDEYRPMPDAPTMAMAFRDHGYQTYAVGKMHVYPQRARIGFDDILLCEEGRHHVGMKADDYELFVAAEGYAGQQYTHAMCANGYMARPWHLPEYLHPTAWTVREMCRTIKRRDPTRPAFWYMSFTAPHPPLVPPGAYLDMYRDLDIPVPLLGDWAAEFDALPYALKTYRDFYPGLRPPESRLARQAFYAQCTYIDHQLRLVIGLLREEGLLDTTIICFTSDHGDMLGNHGLYEKGVFYEESAKIPLIVVPTAAYAHLGHHVVDDRLVELRDVMPTLLEMAGLPIPTSVEGRYLLSSERRDHLYGEHYENHLATRMLRTERFKLVYYPIGNRRQLFDMNSDPDELHDLSRNSTYAGLVDQLTAQLISYLYGSDEDWVQKGSLVGTTERSYQAGPNRGLSGQRGWRFMDPPAGSRY